MKILVPRTDIVAEARSWLGTPYHHRASQKNIGVDCLGLVRGVWRAVIGNEPEDLPIYTRDWGETDNSEPLLAGLHRHFDGAAITDMQSGDILAFRWRNNHSAKHLAILVSPTTFIHACENRSVVEASLSDWWIRHLVAVFSFPGAK